MFDTLPVIPIQFFFGKYTCTLAQVDIPIVARHDCRDAYKKVVKINEDLQFCAGNLFYSFIYLTFAEK